MEAMRRHRLIMKKTTRYALLLASTLVPAMASLAHAQYRIDNGTARDANNRVGSGGFNSGTQLNGRINGLAGNYIVTGNVTGGRAFRGSLGYTDPTSFRGSLGSASFDSYVRDSIGASQMRGTSGAGPNFATIQPQPFFGQSSVAPPTGFARDPDTGTYYLPRAAPGVTAGDGRIDYGGATRSDVQQGLLSSQRIMGGPGLSSTPVGELDQRSELSNLTRMSDFTAIARPFDKDLNITNSTSSTASDTNDVAGSPTAPINERIGPATDEPATATEGSPSLTGQGTVFKNLRALDNNSQYAELRKRLDDQASRPKLPGAAGTESINQVNADILAAREKEKEQATEDKKANETKLPAETQDREGGLPVPKEEPEAPGKLPPAPVDNLNLPRPAAGPTVVPPSAPLEISSLATGVKDKDLSKVLGDAEAAMKQGKFSTAIDAYERAEEMASDDPLVFMGRSIAELGGGYYRSAEVHFRQAFAADRALLLAKFDLRSMLTDERLNTLQSDLAQIAKKNDKDAGPLLLLAFIYYNTGFPERSERALEMVQERAGGNDADAKLLKEAWFPAAAPVEQNK
jgi:tetratricopeptide (TPR) repeat protein